MKYICCLALLFAIIFTSIAQSKVMYVYTLENQQLDSITNINFDSTLTNNQTNYFIGQFNTEIEILADTPPIDDTFPNTQFTIKKRAFDDFDITSFPIRASIKMLNIVNDSIHDACSAIMISKKHVLTSAHCYMSPQTNNISLNFQLACPIYNNANFNPEFDCSNVKKVFFFKDWLPNEDFAILELEEEIGLQTGWVSIGFNDNDDFLEENIYYKFSYPSFPLLILDSTLYNGDTLYYSYGKIDCFNEQSIGISNTHGISGESGSAIYSVENNQNYVVYGTMNGMGTLPSCGSGMKFSRITNPIFSSINWIIQDEIILNNQDFIINTEVIFPNPTKGNIYIKKGTFSEFDEITIFNSVGRRINSINPANITSIDFTDYPKGIYFLFLRTSKYTKSHTLIKM